MRPGQTALTRICQRPELVRRCVQQPEEARLAGVVGEEARFAVEGVGGGGDHDGAAAARFHEAGGGAEGFEGAGEVNGEGAVPGFARGLLEGGEGGDAGIDHERVRRTGFGECGFEGGGAGDVDAARAPGEFGGGGFAIEDPDVRPGFAQQARHGEADAVGAARDHRAFAAKNRAKSALRPF